MLCIYAIHTDKIHSNGNEAKLNVSYISILCPTPMAKLFLELLKPLPHVFFPSSKSEN